MCDQYGWFDPIERITFRDSATPSTVSWWHNSVWDPYGQSPHDLAEKFLTDTPLESVGRYEKIDPTHSTVNLETSLGLNLKPVYLSGITINFNGGRSVFIDLVAVETAHQGQGLATQLLANIYAIAQSINARGLELQATLDAGPWVWLKFGFVPDEHSWQRAKVLIQDKIDEFGNKINLVEKRYVEELLKIDAPNAMSALLKLSRLVPSVPRRNYGSRMRKVPLGFALLVDSGVSWTGKLDFDDPIAMKIFHERVS